MDFKSLTFIKNFNLKLRWIENLNCNFFKYKNTLLNKIQSICMLYLSLEYFLINAFNYFLKLQWDTPDCLYGAIISVFFVANSDRTFYNLVLQLFFFSLLLKIFITLNIY